MVMMHIKRLELSHCCVIRHTSNRETLRWWGQAWLTANLVEVICNVIEHKLLSVHRLRVSPNWWLMMNMMMTVCFRAIMCVMNMRNTHWMMTRTMKSSMIMMSGSQRLQHFSSYIGTFNHHNTRHWTPIRLLMTYLEPFFLWSLESFSRRCLNSLLCNLSSDFIIMPDSFNTLIILMLFNDCLFMKLIAAFACSLQNDWCSLLCMT